ncbi:hypothetical protein WT56_29385 [Burkholderia pseudomultivorans]|uniref:Uncharacterized protein n=1 Tax=Burkholderia pseudomultivorans TaxID=1207504 RepID=A0A132E8H4_9BURK|nr:hypothetical protein WT56_29385 [Burkholderia pseudomultivorans]
MQFDEDSLGQMLAILPTERVAARIILVLWIFAARGPNGPSPYFAHPFLMIVHERFPSSHYLDCSMLRQLIGVIDLEASV